MKRVTTIAAILVCFGLSLFFGWIACGSSSNGNDPNNPPDPEVDCQGALNKTEACAALLQYVIPPDVAAQLLSTCENPPAELVSARDCVLGCASRYQFASPPYQPTDLPQCYALYICGCGTNSWQCNISQYQEFEDWCVY